MAPNKRAENKKLLNLWLNKDLYNSFAALAKKEGVSMTSLITTHIEDVVNKHETGSAYFSSKENYRTLRSH